MKEREEKNKILWEEKRLEAKNKEYHEMLRQREQKNKLARGQGNGRGSISRSENGLGGGLGNMRNTNDNFGPRNDTGNNFNSNGLINIQDGNVDKKFELDRSKNATFHSASKNILIKDIS